MDAPSPPPSRNPLARWAQGLTSEIAAEILRLVTSALGLVAALAWNDAVQAVFKEYFPGGGGITAKFVYAVLVSVLIILLTFNLTRIAELANGKRRKTL